MALSFSLLCLPFLSLASHLCPTLPPSKVPTDSQHKVKLNQVSILGASNGPFLFCGRSSARKDLLKLSTKPAQYIWSPAFKCGYSSPVAGVGIVNQLCGKYKGKSEQKSSSSVQHWIIHRSARAKSPGWDFLGTWNKASAAPGTLHNFVNYLDILVFYFN